MEDFRNPKSYEDAADRVEEQMPEAAAILRKIAVQVREFEALRSRPVGRDA